LIITGFINLAKAQRTQRFTHQSSQQSDALSTNGGCFGLKSENLKIHFQYFKYSGQNCLCFKAQAASGHPYFFASFAPLREIFQCY
jgi:hypothetical protein